MGLLIRFRYVVVLVASTLSLLALFMLAVETGHESTFAWDKLGWDDVDRTAYVLAHEGLWDSRADQVKQAFVHAYSAYEKYAFPHDELFPFNQKGRDNFNGWGVTAFDSLDTMLLMDLPDEFSRGLDLARNMNFTVQHNASLPINSDLSFFETVIRYLGGLLSAYALSHEPILLDKADELATVLAPVFDTPTGLPYSGFHLLSGRVNNRTTVGLLAEVATCQLEYAYLARLTGKKEHYTKAAQIFHTLGNLTLNETTMIPTRLSIQTGLPGDGSLSVGAAADSGHEYLLKYHLLTGQKDKLSLDLYMQMVNEVLMKMLYLSPNRGLLYITDIFSYSGKPSHNLEHLSCFFPGLLALGVNTLPDEVFANAHALFTATQAKRLSSYNMKDLHMWAAIGLGETCWRMYADNPTGLSPEIIRMPAPMTHPDPKSPIPDSGLWLDALDLWTSSKTGATPPGLDDKTLQNATDSTEKDYRIIRGDYLLRPETVESIYILWKATGDPRWRERNWAIFQSIEKHTKLPAGYGSFKKVSDPASGLNNEMPSFFLAETLKYLYLTFTNDDPISLDNWVFNTEAHPLPVFSWSSWEKHKFGMA